MQEGEGMAYLDSKRLDRFITTKDLINGNYIVKSWVGTGGMSDHLPVLLKIDKEEQKSSNGHEIQPWLVVGG
jgi:hypothetical protein